jgi:hypothetical protein
MNFIPKIKFNLFLLITLFAVSAANAQLFGDQLDSLEQQRLDNIKVLQAKPLIQNKVDYKIDQQRLLMLSQEWFGIPTYTEQKKIENALESKYLPYNTSLENPAWLNKNGVFYRNKPGVYRKQSASLMSKNSKLSAPIVMGWHPYWEGGSYKTYNYKLLTHLAFYGYEVNPFTGGYKNFEAINDFVHNEIIMTAHLDSCKVLLTVSCRGFDENEIFFTSEPEVQQNLIDSLRYLLQITGADGVDLNFEDVPLNYKAHFLGFVEALSFGLREDDFDNVISMTLPLYDEDNVFDLEKLQPWVDFFVISGHDFHIQPTELKEGPLSPLLSKDASIRGTQFLYQVYTTLDKLLASPYDISDVILEQSPEYEKKLIDSLNYQIRWIYRNLEYKPFDLTDVLNTIKITKDHTGRPMWMTPAINRLLRRTNCIGVLSKKYDAARKNEQVGFFIFEPKKDSLVLKELDLFENITVVSEVDSQMFDLNALVQVYKNRIGSNHASSLVLGLTYNGAVWYKGRGLDKKFDGYMPYSEIIRLAERGRASIVYDKATHSLEATVRDSLGGVYKIYFDNSTSLGRKFDFAASEDLGGVGIWPLGADYAHTDLWSTIEASFYDKKVWNADKSTYQSVKVDKANKVGYTLLYLLKRFSALIFATLIFIAIFICISFGFSILDWKVRDVLFYSGAFRIFYLILFTIVLLILGNTFNWFQNKALTFAIGTGLGLLLTWIASNLVQNNHQKLP